MARTEEERIRDSEIHQQNAEKEARARLDETMSPENLRMLREEADSGKLDLTTLPYAAQYELAQTDLFDESEFTGESASDGTEQAFTIEDDEAPLMNTPAPVMKGLPDEQTRLDNVVLGVGLAAMARGDSISAAIASALGSGAEEYHEDILQAGTEAMAEEDIENVERHLDGVNPNQPSDEVADDVGAASDWMQERQDSIVKSELMFYEALVNPDVAEEVVRKKAIKMRLGRMGQQILGEMGVWDWAKNIGNLMIPLGQMVDNYDMAEILADEGSIGTAFSPGDFMAKFKNRWDGLSAEEQEALLPSLQEELAEELPEIPLAQFLEFLSGSSDQTDFWGQYGDFQTGVNIAESILTPLAVVRGLVKAYSVTRVIKEMNALGASDDAAELLAVAVKSQEGKGVRAAQTDIPEVVEILSPLRPVSQSAEAFGDIGPKVIRNLELFDLRMVKLTEDARDGKLFNREGMLTQREQDIGAQRLQRKFANKRGITDVVVESSKDRWIVRYTKTDNKGNKLDQTEEVRYRVDKDTQEMEFEDPGILSRVFGSPLAWANKDFMTEVRRNIRLDATQARMFEVLRNLHLEAIQPVLGKGVKGAFNTFSPATKRRLNKVNDVLLSGDSQEKVYTVFELKSGKVGYKLDDAEIETYFKMRRLYDTLYELRNDELRRTLMGKGMMHVDMPNSVTDFGMSIGRPLRNHTDARNSVLDKGARYYYDEETGSYKQFSFSPGAQTDELTDLVELYKNGYILVKLDEPQDLAKSGNKVGYAMVQSDYVKPLPFRVLHKVEGYVPKINDQAAYFVKSKTRATVDGATSKTDVSDGHGVETLRAFSNRKEAEAWAEEQNRLLREAGIPPEQKIIYSVADRQLEQERLVGVLDEPTTYSGGGLYTGKRSSTDIPWGAKGEPQPRVNAFEAIERNMASVARYVTRNEARLGMEERALKTANMLLAREQFGSQGRLMNFDALRGVNADTPNGRRIKAMYDQINDWNAMPTASERYTKQLIQGIVDSSIGHKLPGWSTKGLHSLKSSDPIGAARAAAFHGLLGWFNPVQMWVQAQGATVAMSMNILNPAELGRVMKGQFAIQHLQYLNRSEANLAHTAKALKMSKDELADMMDVWDKSGLVEGILQTADHAAAARGHGYGLTALSRAADRGLWFYRAGELFNRRLSFVTAYRERLAKLGKGAKLGERDIQDVLDRANDLMLNLSKANRASWQKGVFSLFTQFAQVNSKTVESLLGANGAFTWGERGKLVGGQIALYGGAGFPMGNLAATWLMEVFGVDNQTDLEEYVNPKTVKFLNEGITGWATMAALGVDIEIGERSSLLGGVGRFADDLVFGEGTVADKILGAFGNVNSRFWSSFFQEYEPISLGLAESRALDPVKAVLNPLFGSISTFRNIDKAIVMHRLHKIFDSSYTPVVGPKNFTLMQEFAAAMGFRLTEEVQAYSMQERNQADRDFKKKMVTELAKIYYQYAVARNSGDTISEEKLEEYRESTALIYQMFDANERADVARSLQDKLTNMDSKYSKEWNTYMKNNDDSMTETLWKDHQSLMQNLHRILGSGGIIQHGNLFQEEAE